MLHSDRLLALPTSISFITLSPKQKHNPIRAQCHKTFSGRFLDQPELDSDRINDRIRRSAHGGGTFERRRKGRTATKETAKRVDRRTGVDVIKLKTVINEYL